MSTLLDRIEDILSVHEFDIPCEHTMVGRDPECDRPVRWILYRTPCCEYAVTHPTLLCTEHKDARLANTMAVECIGCGHVEMDATAAYTLIEPLK